MTPDELYKIRHAAEHQYGGSLVLKLCDEYEALVRNLKAAGYGFLGDVAEKEAAAK